MLSGVTLHDANYQSGNGEVYEFDSTGYTFEFYIPENVLTSGSAMLAYINGGMTGTATNTQYSYVLSVGTNNTYTLTMGRSNLTTDPTDITWNPSGSVDNALLANTAYKVTVTGTNSQTIVVSKSEDPSHFYTRTIVGGQLVFAQGVTTPTTGFNTAFAVPAPAVPEPATATLSLLALASLAARRRRK